MDKYIQKSNLKHWVFETKTTLYFMGKKFSVVLQKPKCLKCGRRLQVDRSETNYNAGKITAYCFNRQYHDGLILKFKIESMISNTPTADIILNVKQIRNDLD